MKSFIKKIRSSKMLLLFAMPTAIWYLIVSYLPMIGLAIAFKNYQLTPGKGFFYNLIHSPWVGFKNFEFLFKSVDAWVITRNTILYNASFIVINIVVPLIIALCLHELLNKKFAKFYQSALFLPYFLSWIVVSYCLFIFLSPDKGLINSWLLKIGIDPISWYNDLKAWPFIFILVNTWKNIGYNTVIFLAAIAGIDKTYYEAAMLDGASKWQQIKSITIPLLSPVIIVLFILAIGNIFRADFGLFYQLPMNSGPLLPVSNVIDTYVYRALMNSGDIAMSSAAGFYQSIVGFVMIVGANWLVRKVDAEKAMF